MPDGGAGEAKKSEAPAAVEPGRSQPIESRSSAEPIDLAATVNPAVATDQAPTSETLSGSQSSIPAAEMAPSTPVHPETYLPQGPNNPMVAPAVADSSEPAAEADLAGDPAIDAQTAAASSSASAVVPIEVTHGGELAVRWVGLIDRIGLSGMTYNIAANASLRSVQINSWCFTLTSQQLHLFNATHQQRLAQALSDHLGEAIAVEVIEVAVGAASESETPAQYQERKRQERQVLAVKAIESDPEVQTIIANYDARIDPSSIKPIDNGEPVR